MRASRVAALLILCYAIGEARSGDCPEDSVRDESGGCKCAVECPPTRCPEGERSVQVKAADPETAGSCCARYDCVPTDSRDRGFEPCPENTVLTEDGECECAPCPPATCQPGHLPVPVRAALDRESPLACCPLYDCRPSETVSWVKVASEDAKPANYCIHQGEAKKPGERWQEVDACVSCVCEKNGKPSCQALMCKFCENSIPPEPGECCPHCPIPTNATLLEPEPPSCRTTLENCTLACEHGYVTDENDCPSCICAQPQEEDADAEPVPEERPPTDAKICPELPHCGLNCDLVKDEGGCSVCACQNPQTFDEPANDTVLIDEAGKKICPEVKCDLHCERGLVMDENDCTFCKCRTPESNCPRLVGCRKRCAFGYKTNKRGCPICRCRASCTDHLNDTHPEGSTWHPNSCTRCTCEAGGRLSCRETICSVACGDPLPPKPGTCCPICPITAVKENGTSQPGNRGWGTVPITLIVILALLCLLLIVHTVRTRFRARLSPSIASYSTYPPQYYKCVPAYDTPMHRSEKTVRL